MRILTGLGAIGGLTAVLTVSAQDLAIRNTTLLTITKGTVENGTIVVKGGKIAAVGGPDVAVPDGVRTIDGTGLFVMPGIVDTHSHMGVYPWPGVDANADGNESTNPITPQVRAEDSVNVEDPAFARALAGGVTTIQILPGSANLIGGLTFTCKLRLDAPSIEHFRFAGAPRGIKMASGENPKRVYGSRNQLPSTRMGNAALFRETFTKTKEYMEKWDAWEKKKKTDPDAAPPERDLRWEVLADVLRGKILVHQHCYRTDEVMVLLQIADEFGWKHRSLQHCLEGYKFADEIARRGIGVATFSDWWGYKVESWDAIPYNAAMLARKGVRVCVHSDSSNIIQRLYHEAAKCVHYGMTEEDALKAITIHPAWILGVDDRVGSLEPGKDADLAVFSKHPFDMYTRVRMTVIDGKVQYELK